MDLFRCRKRLPKGRGEVGSLAEIPDRLADPPGDECDINQLGSLFHRAIQLARAEFGDRTWEAFWRATVANEPTRQVAAELGISSNGVRQARSRVLRRIRLLLGGINE
jgi:RNA polymerase sigma-70 factor (ECF subfamily)